MEMDSCFFCGEPSDSVCPQCGLVASCSAEHYTFHRPKGRCFPFRVGFSEERGMHLVAARNIKALEVILEEYPAFVGPYSKTAAQCVECFRPWSLSSHKSRCARCNMAVCGEKCARGRLHEVECAVMQRVGFRADEHSNGTTNDDDVNAETPGENGNDENEDYENGNESDDDDDDDEDDTSFNVNYGVVTAIRALAVKERNPTKWKAIERLLDHNSRRDAAAAKDQQAIVDKLVGELGYPEKRRKEIEHVVGLISVNSVNLNLDEGKGKGTGLYVSYARINHSCLCNTKSVKFQDHRLELRASCAIPAGAEITNQYVKPRIGTVVRRAILAKKWFFDCQCRRCADPAENGSLLSGIVCTECGIGGGGGTALPREPLNHNTDWLCESCRHVIPRERVEQILNTSTDEMEEATRDIDNDRDLITRYEEWIYANSTRLLPTHYLVVEVQTQLGFLYGSEDYPIDQMTRTELVRKVQLCQHALDTIGKVDRGYSSWRAKLLYELTHAKVTLAKREFKTGHCDQAALMKALQEEQFLGMYLAYYQTIFFAGKTTATEHH